MPSRTAGSAISESLAVWLAKSILHIGYMAVKDDASFWLSSRRGQALSNSPRPDARYALIPGNREAAPEFLPRGR